MVLGSCDGLVFFIFEAGFFQVFGCVGKTVFLGGFFSVCSWPAVEAGFLQGCLLALVSATARGAGSSSGSFVGFLL